MKNVLSNINLFNKISAESGYIDPETIKKIYFGLLRVILSELRNSGRIKLTDWGEFRITTYKERKVGDLNNPGNCLKLFPTNVIKFTACNRLREYIKNIKNEY